MYSNSAYTNHNPLGYKDKSKKLVICSCGTYKLISISRLPTYRPRGRIDWQMIYVAHGKAFFHFDSVENETVVTAGHIVIFQPRELQKYEYYGKDKTEVFWVHFTGNDVKILLKKYGFQMDQHVYFTGVSAFYPWIFQRMIQELQLKQNGYEEMLTMFMCQILISISRHFLEVDEKPRYLEREVEEAQHYFTEHYSSNLNISEYAASIGVSSCWFIKQFKEQTGTTPMNYVLNLRITNAQHLLETTKESVTEIAGIVGYENPLYFSRLFKKQFGMSPTAYRKQFLSSSES